MSVFDPTPDTGRKITSPASERAATKPARSPAAKSAPPPLAVNLGLSLLPGEYRPGYATRHVDLQLELNTHRAVLKLLVASLQARGERLLCGSLICTPRHAVLWLLEAIAVELPAEVLEQFTAGVD